MDQTNWRVFYDRLGYYEFGLLGLALAGILGFSLLPASQRKKKAVKLSLTILIVVAGYEWIGVFLGAQKIVNNWVYNIFSSHIATVLFFLLIRSFLKRETHQRIVDLLILSFLLISLVLHLVGLAHYNDSGEYISLLYSVFILWSCGLYFFELLTLEELLQINPLRQFSFWTTTAVLFYFSSSFMVYISVKYLYTNHLDIFHMVIEIPRNMTLFCNFLLCLGIYSLVIKDRYQIQTIHV